MRLQTARLQSHANTVRKISRGDNRREADCTTNCTSGYSKKPQEGLIERTRECRNAFKRLFSLSKKETLHFEPVCFVLLHNGIDVLYIYVYIFKLTKK